MIRKILFLILFVGLYHTGHAQLPGDDCASAVPITLFPGTTVSTGFQEIPASFTNTILPANICIPPYTRVGSSKDGFYTIDVTVPGDYYLAFANNGTTRKGATIYSGGCPATFGNCIGYVFSNNTRDGGLGHNSGAITLAVGTYYIVIDGWLIAATYPPGTTGGNNPAFELLITSPIDNDECINPTELFSTVDCSYVTYTNEGATGSVGAPAPGCANYQGGDVWFSYEVNASGEFTVSTEAGVMTDSGMAIYSGPNCGSLSLVSCNDDFAGSGLMSAITVTGRTPGETMYIRIWEFGNNNNGTFGICVTTPIPPGDTGVYSDCPNERGFELTSDYTCPPGANSSNVVYGNLEGGLLANRLVTSVVNSPTCGFAAGTPRRYQGINFTVPTTGLYVIESTAAAFDSMGYIVVDNGLFVPGSCGTGTYVMGDDDSGVGVRAELTVNLTAGINYTLITTEWGSGGTGNSPYTWTVTSGPNINWTTPVAIDWYTAETGGTYLKTGPGLSPVNFPGSGLTDTGTPGIYTFWYECTSAPGTRFPVEYVIGKVWKGTTSSDWNTATNWSNDELPTDSQCVFIPAGSPNDPIINDNDNGDGLNLTIATGATLTLASDVDADDYAASLTIQNQIRVQGTGSLIVENDASLIQVNDTPPLANSGSIALSRITDIRRYDYVYWSSPVQGFNVNNVYGANTPASYTFEWIPTIDTGFNAPGILPTGGMRICFGNWNVRSMETMNPGKGYAVRGPSNIPNAITTVTSTFTGVPNNGVITQPITSGTNSSGNSTYVNDAGLVVTHFDDNWNLIGNPYPSAVDADAFLTHPSNTIIDGAVHVWTHNAPLGSYSSSFYANFGYNYEPNDYTTYNLSGANSYFDELFGGKIASGQGFFVLALNDNETGSVTFNNSMRDRSHSNTDFYRTANENIADTNSTERERSRIWLNLIGNNGGISSIMVGYIEGATHEKDRLFDAYAREANSMSLYSKIGDERMLIQGRALPFDDQDQIPLGMVIPQAGEYTITISNVDGLFLDDSQDIYLEDTLTGTIHNLRAEPYTFTESESIDYADRFFLRYTDDALSITDVDLRTISIMAPRGEYIKINSGTSPIEAVTVYDLLGRALIENNGLNTSDYVINNHNLSSGAYIVKVTLSSGLTKTQKVVLKQ